MHRVIVRRRLLCSITKLMPPPLIDFAAEGRHRELEEWCQRSNTLQPLDLNIRDHLGNTALIHASSLGSVRSVNSATSEGIPKHQALREQATVAQDRLPAHLVECFAESVGSLIEHGADANARGQDGATALAWASIVGHPPIAHSLLEAGADVDQADDNGNTALMNAVRWAHADAPFGAYQAVAFFLVENGADTKCKNVHGESAESILTSRLKDEEDEEMRLAELANILQLGQ